MNLLNKLSIFIYIARYFISNLNLYYFRSINTSYYIYNYKSHNKKISLFLRKPDNYILWSRFPLGLFAQCHRSSKYNSLLLSRRFSTTNSEDKELLNISSSKINKFKTFRYDVLSLPNTTDITQ